MKELMYINYVGLVCTVILMTILLVGLNKKNIQAMNHSESGRKEIELK